MWQFSWMVSLIPDETLSLVYWVIIGVGITGLAAGWLGRWIPFYGKYVQILKPLGVLLLVLGVWLRGGYDTEMAWRAKVAEVEAKLAEAKIQSEKVNTVVETKVITKTKIIKEKADTIVQYVDRVKEIVKFDETCPIPKEAIDVHNEAAKMNKAIEEMRKGANK